jgi:glycosyltransferase involved in cell wall biosynthesis
MPLVWQRQPELRLRLAGKFPPERLLELAASESRVEWIANPPDMSSVAADCCLSLVPLRIGGGTRLKVLDSFALGLPVVSTRLGAEGHGARAAQHYWEADGAGAFAEGITSLWDRPELRLDLSRAGRAFVERHGTWDHSFAPLERELEAMVGRSGG